MNTLGVVHMIAHDMVPKATAPGLIVEIYATIYGNDGIYGLGAHRSQGSITVHPRDRIATGALLGRRVSGRKSNEPGVHIAFMDRASPWSARGVPGPPANVVVGDQTRQFNSSPPSKELMFAMISSPQGCQ